MQMNEEQREAVEHKDGPLLVIAGAGSGKTRVVVGRIVHLIESGVLPSRILGLTFTNKAAREMQERIQHNTNHFVYISTFHSLGARLLREFAPHLGYPSTFTIYDEEDALKLLKTILTELGVPEKKADAKKAKAWISKAKNDMILPKDASDKDEDGKVFKTVYERYQEKLFEYQSFDFDDLLLQTARLFKEHPDVLARVQDRYDYLLIDEYQDTNEVQYEIVHLLIQKKGNICVVGDPDQSIYSWRGANIRNILDFEKDFPGAKVVRLEQNYRSKGHILQAANGLISHNDQRFHKKLWSNLGEGEKVQVYAAENEHGESDFVIEKILHFRDKGFSFKDMVIFYRTNFQSRVFEDALLQNNIPYVIVGGMSFYQRKEIKDILSFLRMVQSGSDGVSFTRTINLPKRGLGEATIEKILQGATNEGVSLLAYCQGILDDHTEVALTKKQKEGLYEYVSLIKDLQKLAKNTSLDELMRETIQKTKYMEYLLSDPETFEDRRGNVEELIAKAADWQNGREDPSLSAFLEELSLRSTLDEADAKQKEHLCLMTLHNGKGLEFPITFVVGLEEDLLPHINSKQDEGQIQEERRLCYVGMTRAKERLFLSHVKERFLWGSVRRMRESRFLREVPKEHTDRARRQGSYYEPLAPSPDESPSVFLPQDRVIHPLFGRGTVLSSRLTSVGLTYQIHFDADDSRKEIAARYAKLSSG